MEGEVGMEEPINLSFSGCGFLGIYHVGVASAIKQYAPHIGSGKIAGASGGAIAAACFVCDCCLGAGTSDVLRIVIQARKTALGPIHPSFRLVKMLREGLRDILPPNAHELCTGRLYISVTRFSDGKNVLISTFDTREELIQAIVCSSFIPFYSGTVPPLLKGQRYIDGGWSNNLPTLEGRTVTVSPFSGESDICPQDSESASLFAPHVAHNSIRMTSANLYRLSVALFPPHPEVLSRMCGQGFEDALRFLAGNGLVNCTRCLAVRSSIRLPDSERQPEPKPEPPKARRLSTIRGSTDGSHCHTHRRRLLGLRDSANPTTTTDLSECEECASALDSAPQKGLHPQVTKTLQKVESDYRNSWANWVLSIRPVKWIRYAMIPWTYPLDLTYQTCIRVLEWLPQLPSDAVWLIDRIKAVVHFVLTELDRTGQLYSARFTCQLAVTELSIAGPGHNRGAMSRASSFSGVPAVEDEGAEERSQMDFGFSVDLQPNHHSLSGILRRDTDYATQDVVNAAEGLERAGLMACKDDPADPGPANDTDMDSVAAIVEYTNRHDALVSYYYRDYDNTIKVCEIFGVEDEEEGNRIHEAVSRGGLSRRQSFAAGSIHEPEEPPPPDPGCRPEASKTEPVKVEVGGSAAHTAAVQLRKSGRTRGRHVPSYPPALSGWPSEDSDTEALFVPRRPRTLSEEARAYDGESSSTDGN